MSLLVEFADFVTLVYHEARNVRHVIRAGAVDLEPWKQIVSLPTNRDDAWVALQDIRQTARSRADVRSTLQGLEERFRVALPQLEDLYGNAAWRNSAYGGNAWFGITKSVRRLAECLDQRMGEEAAEVRACLLAARHNTGTVMEKLRRLDEVLPKPLKPLTANRPIVRSINC